MTPNQLPPLPEPDTHCFDDDTGKDVWSYTADQMHAYALAAIAQQAQPVYWEWRHLGSNQHAADFGQWSQWQKVEARSLLSTVEDELQEFRRYIADGYKYELRALYTTPPAPQVPAPVDEREAFERWCGPFSELRRSDFDPGRYCHSGVSLAWDAWQARAALQSQAHQTKGQP